MRTASQAWPRYVVRKVNKAQKRGAGDDQEPDDARVDQVVDPGSQWCQCEYCTNIGFAA